MEVSDLGQLACKSCLMAEVNVPNCANLINSKNLILDEFFRGKSWWRGGGEQRAFCEIRVLNLR